MKHVLVTGVSTGIGYAAAQAFVLKGYHVYGSVRRQVDAEKTQRALGPQFSPLLFDVTDHLAIAEAAKKVEAEIGKEGLACLINNAGISTSGPLMLQPLDDIRRQFEVNVIGLFAVIQAFLPLLGAQRNASHPPGRIINISSVSGKIAAPFVGAYVGSKHAVEGMSHSLRRELQLYGIDVILVGPGPVKTGDLGQTFGHRVGNICGERLRARDDQFPKILCGIVEERRVISRDPWSSIGGDL